MPELANVNTINFNMVKGSFFFENSYFDFEQFDI